MATWTPLDRDHYWLDWNGETWHLKATPKAKYPWLLYTERDHNGRPVRDKQQEIGAPKPEDARHAAETWLGLAKYCA